MSNVVFYMALGAILAPSNLYAPLRSSTSIEQVAASVREERSVDVGTVNNEEEDKPSTDLTSTTKSALSIEAEEELELFGIKNAAPNVKLFAKNQIKQAKKKDEMISQRDNKIGELKSQKDQYEPYKYCNIYRLETEQFEALFGKPSFSKAFPTFLTVFNFMVPVFQRERKEDKTRKEIVFNGDNGGCNGFSKLSRVEKWRVIMLWFVVLESGGENTTSSTADPMPSTEVLLLNSKQLESDFKELESEKLYLPAAQLRQECMDRFEIPRIKLEDIPSIQNKLEEYAQGFHFAFQRCSKEVKLLRNLAHHPDGYAAVCARIRGDPSEKVHEITINMCLNVTVSVGKALALKM